MNYDELAFVNQQLASMLRDGIPLEGGLRHLCETMQRGKLRRELQQLESDLAAGMPLGQAAARRRLPEFYLQVLQLGARSNDLPGILLLLADYYSNAGVVWTRLKGLMVYPAIVLLLSCAFSLWLALLSRQLITLLSYDANWLRFSSKTAGAPPVLTQTFWWMPPAILTAAAVPCLLVVVWPGLRRELAWRLPAFRESSLARAASTLAILLRAGCTMTEAFAALEQMESGTRAAADLARWRRRCADGAGKFNDISAGSKVFAPMFRWLVCGAGEDVAAGFERAARVYQARAAYRTNVLLYAALPASLLFIGLIILAQIYPMGMLIFDLPRFFMGF